MLDIYGARGWPWREVDDPPALVSELTGPLGTHVLLVQIVEASRLLVFYGILAVTVPEDRRPAVAEYLARVSPGLSIGSLELDFADGEVRTRVPLVVGEALLDDVLVERMIRITGRLVELFQPGLEAVIAGTAPAEAATAVAGAA
jgi:hypothetical protein